MTLTTTPLSELDGKFVDLGCDPVTYLRLHEWDCCRAEVWVVIGPSLGDDPSVLVEVCEGQQHHYHAVVEFEPVDSFVAPTFADLGAVLLAIEEDSSSYGRLPCRCDYEPYPTIYQLGGDR